MAAPLLYLASQSPRRRQLLAQIGDQRRVPVRYEDIPDDWACPVCGAGKDAFEKA